MTAALLVPAGLAALAALLLPLAIHLARRTEQVPTDFAALRWLRQKPRPRHRPRFDEIALLAARLVLLALLAAWLARPVLNGERQGERWVAVVPGADPARAGADADVRRVWLAPGFPAVDTSRSTAPVAVASLLRELDADLPPGARLTVLVPTTLAGLDAERPRLSRRVTWRVGPGASPAQVAGPAAIPKLSVRGAAGAQYFRAAAIAWQPPGRPAAFESAGVEAALPAADRVLVWLAPGPLPARVGEWIERGGTALLAATVDFALPDARVEAWRDAVGAPLIEGAAVGRGRALRLTRALDAAAMPELLAPDFPRALAAALDPPAVAPGRAFAGDVAPTAGGRSYPQPAVELRPWLAVLIGALLLGERWLATRRRRAAAP